MNFKRHKYERILGIISLVISTLVVLTLIYFGNMSIKSITAKDMLNNMLIEEELWIINIVEYVGGYIVIVILVVIIISLIIRFYRLNISAIACDIHVSPKQFPELYNFEIECAKKLGLEEIPKMYITPGFIDEVYISGVKFDNKHILRISAAEVFNTVNDNYDVAKLSIARKLAAIHFGYYNTFLNIITAFSHWIPILNQLNNRAMSYSCDNAAVAILGKETVAKALVKLYTGFYITPYVNIEEYIDNAENVINDRSVIFENIMEDIPIVAYRLEAILTDRDGRLF